MTFKQTGSAVVLRKSVRAWNALELIIQVIYQMPAVSI